MSREQEPPVLLSEDDVARSGLRAKLLRSHATIAILAVGAMVCFATIMWWMRGNALNLSNLYTPTAVAAADLSLGVQRSMATQRSWILLKEARFRDRRLDIWQDEIEPTLKRLHELSAHWDDSGDIAVLHEVTEALHMLRRVQWWIEETADSVGNEPCRTYHEQEIRPLTDSTQDALYALIGMEERNPLQGREHDRMILQGFRADFLQLQILMDRYERGVDEHKARQIMEWLAATGLKLNGLTDMQARLTPEQQEALAWVEMNFQAISRCVPEFVSICVRMESTESLNVAESMLRKEAIPLTYSINRQLASLSRNAIYNLNQSTMFMSLATELLLILSLVGIFVLGFVTIVLSARAAIRIAGPIVKLSRATVTLAQGELHEDIPVQSSDEIGQLTMSFNIMRARLEETIDELAHARDTLEEKVAERTAELERMTRIDGLTGLNNRRFFDDVLDKEWLRMKRSGESMALIMCDIDKFKEYNDAYGHQAGDACLQSIAQSIMSGGLRSSDVSVRYGGEEFAIILPKTDLEGGRMIAERIRRHIEDKQMAHVTGYGVVTMSFGIAALVPDDGHGPDLLVSLADKALYASKKNGRNRVSDIQS